MEKKHMKKIEKTDFIVFFIFLIFAIGNTAAIKFDANDELWNFSNTYKMLNGYLIYKDLNVIITPLFFYIGEGIMKLIGANYLSFRIYNVFIIASTIYVVYMIFKELKIEKMVSCLCATLIGFGFILPLSSASADYNVLAIEIFLIGIYLNLKVDSNNKWLPYIQGLIAFLVFYTKQNIGVYYLAGSFFMHLEYAIKKNSTKKETSKFIKEALTFSVLLGIAALSLYIKGNLYDFIDMCFLGIHDFASNNTAIDITCAIVIVVSIISIIYSVFLLKSKNVEEKIKEYNLMVLPFTVFALPIMYPIFNKYHIYLATIPAIVFFVANIYITFTSQICSEKGIKKVCKYFIIVTIIIGIITTGINSYFYLKSINTYIDPYFGSRISEEQIKSIEEVKQFIEKSNNDGYDVKVVSYMADYYMNLLNKNNGKFDLPFHGNLGSKGEQGLIEEINNLNKCKILIQKDDNIFFQESKEIRQYIKNNLKQDGEIGIYVIYTK